VIADSRSIRDQAISHLPVRGRRKGGLLQCDLQPVSQTFYITGYAFDDVPNRTSIARPLQPGPARQGQYLNICSFIAELKSLLVRR